MQAWRVDRFSTVRDGRAEAGRLRDVCCYLFVADVVASSGARATTRTTALLRRAVYYWLGARAKRDQLAVAALHAATFARALRAADGVLVLFCLLLFVFVCVRVCVCLAPFYWK